MPIFLTRNDLYRILQRELPPGGVYPDSGDSTKFYSTADNDATAACIADYYCSQKQTYNNYFPISATGTNGRLSDHEQTWFGYQLDESIYNEAQRLALLLAKIRYQPIPTLWNILTLVLTFVPQGTRVGIIPRYQNGPFIYDVNIYETTFPAATVNAITIALLSAGPARSQFFINQNVNLAAYGLNFFLPNVDNTSLVQNAFVDPNSTITGYTGLVNYDTDQQFAITDQSGNILTDQLGDYIVTQGSAPVLTDQDGNIITDQEGNSIATQQNS